MATPHVSGAAALIGSKCLLTPAELKAYLINPDNVDPLPSLDGKTVSGGRLNVDKAIRKAIETCTPPPSDFSLSASPSSLTIPLGGEGTSTITVTSLNDFTGTVDLTVSETPPGMTADLNPTSVSGSGNSLLRVKTGTATAGTYALTITGTSGTLTHSTQVTLNVGTPTFTITASPMSRTVYRGFSTTYKVTITRELGFNGNVVLSLTVPPNANGKISGTFKPTSITNPGTSSTLTVRTKSGTTPGTYTLDIYGTSNGISKKVSVSLAVTKLFGILGRGTEAEAPPAEENT
jgi:hypothetical protein